MEFDWFGLTLQAIGFITLVSFAVFVGIKVTEKEKR